MPTLTGTVLIAGTDIPLDRASVWADVQTNAGDIHRNTRTDVHGSFLINDIPIGLCKVHTQFDVETSRTPFRFSFSATEGPFDLSSDRSLTLKVESAGCLAGFVRNALTGHPVRGAVVELLETTGGQYRAATEADGFFYMSRVNSQSYTLICSCLGYERIRLKVFVPDVLKDRLLELPLFLNPAPSATLGESGVVRGIVFNEGGNPTQGAEVVLLAADGCQMSAVTGHLHTERGNYEFLNVPGGRHRITVMKPGMEPGEAVVEVAKGSLTWAPDIYLRASSFITPPELEHLRVEPRVLTVGDPLTVSLKTKGRQQNIAASAQIWGTGGWNIGFAIDKHRADGFLERVFDRWPQTGFFKLTQVVLVDGDTGKSFIIPVDVTFEASPRDIPPLTSDSPLFTTS